VGFTSLLVGLRKLRATALLVLLRPGPLLQTVACDLELNLKVGQCGKRALQLGQNVILIKERFGQASCRVRLGDSGIGMSIVPHLAPSLVLQRSGSWDADHQPLFA